MSWMTNEYRLSDKVERDTSVTIDLVNDDEPQHKPEIGPENVWNNPTPDMIEYARREIGERLEIVPSTPTKSNQDRIKELEEVIIYH